MSDDKEKKLKLRTLLSMAGVRIDLQTLVYLEVGQIQLIHDIIYGDVAKSEGTHDGHTLRKVYEALNRSGLDKDQSAAAVNEMQNSGILFRERMS